MSDIDPNKPTIEEWREEAAGCGWAFVVLGILLFVAWMFLSTEYFFGTNAGWPALGWGLASMGAAALLFAVSLRRRKK
jgi:hypothetical protein